jgi:hypothetical protein
MYRHILKMDITLTNKKAYWKIAELYEDDNPKGEEPVDFSLWILKTFNGSYGYVSGSDYDSNGDDWGWKYYIDFESEEDLLLFKLKTGL